MTTAYGDDRYSTNHWSYKAGRAGGVHNLIGDLSDKSEVQRREMYGTRAAR